MTYGESETLKLNVLISDNNIYQDLFKEDLTTNKTDVLTAFSTDHSPLLFSLDLRKYKNRGKGFWKFHNSLSMNSDFVTKMKFHIKTL